MSADASHQQDGTPTSEARLDAALRRSKEAQRAMEAGAARALDIAQLCAHADEALAKALAYIESGREDIEVLSLESEIVSGF